MKKLMIVLAGLLLTTEAVNAETRVFGIGSEGYQFKASMGVAWYTDHRGYDAPTGVDLAPVNDIALYLQTPIVEWNDCYLAFGGIVPVQHANRARPEFSLCTHWGELEVGVYGAVSPYKAWGVMIGIQF